MAVGPVTVSATNSTLNLRAEGEGTLAADGQLLTIDLLLQNNLINLPVSRWDASNFLFDIQRDGSILNGSDTVFAGTAAGDRWGLAARRGGERHAGALHRRRARHHRGRRPRDRRAAGRPGGSERDAQDLRARVRLLHALSRGADQPVGSAGYGRCARDVAPAADRQRRQRHDDHHDVERRRDARRVGCRLADRWVVTDDQADEDPFLTTTLPSTAFVFDGAGGARRAGQTGFGPVSAAGFPPVV